jgi:transposase
LAVITDEVYVEIELLRKHGMSLRKIAEEVGCAVNTVRSHLAAETWPHYQRNTQRVTKLSAFVDYLCERQAAAHPAWIPATVLLLQRGPQSRPHRLRPGKSHPPAPLRHRHP